MKIRADYFPGLNYTGLPAQPDGTSLGVLHNGSGTFAAPVVDDLVFFHEADFFSEQLLLQKCQEIYEKTVAPQSDYERFVRQKGRRPSYDIYACFHPFNEAFKAFFPFIEILRKRLKDGDLILNLWDRTGWSAAFLAGLFPKQRVINFWEGDKDTLGYKGFYFWYKEQDPGENPVQVGFIDLDKALPFPDDTVGLAFGYDTFHRVDQSHILQELYRVVRPDGAILFPHVHLTNAEPDPFFERGCRQLHGLEYHAFFSGFNKASGRKGYLLPEPEMFLYNELAAVEDRLIQSDPDSHHYNTSVAILPNQWEKEEKLHPFRLKQLDNLESARILINPLLNLDLHRQVVRQDPGYLSDRVGYLLERHPVYLKKLVQEETLSELEVKMLYWAKRLVNIEDIATTLQVGIEDLKPSLERLQNLDVIQAVPVTGSHMRLQHYVSTQEYVLPEKEQTIHALWDRASRMYADRLFIISEFEDFELSYSEADELIKRIQGKLQLAGLRPGVRIAMVSSNHFEAVLTMLAALHMGLVVVPIDYELPAETITQILQEIEAEFLFGDHTHAELLSGVGTPFVLLDTDEETETPVRTYFSDWLDDAPESTSNWDYIPSSSDLASILFTSGSTGVPKGVTHTHGHLVRSGRLISETFRWLDQDRFFSPGELDSMSGFRNHCFAPLEVGASIVIAKAEHKAHLFALAELMSKYEVSILGTTPALLSQLLRYKERLRADLSGLKTIMCTGSNLSSELRKNFLEAFGIPILNYYGLTETTGICLSEGPDDYVLDKNTIGKPVGCVAQVISPDGRALGPGERGELRIYSDNIMLGYYQQAEKTSSMIRDGWLYTGDIAAWQANGHLELLGRTRDIIKIATGQLVFASEIEHVLLEKKELVANAAVVSFEQEDIEQIIAFVTLPHGVAKSPDLVQELKEHVIDRLGARKAPLQVQFLEEMPISANGKILKNQLIEQHLKS